LTHGRAAAPPGPVHRPAERPPAAFFDVENPMEVGHPTVLLRECTRCPATTSDRPLRVACRQGVRVIPPGVAHSSSPASVVQWASRWCHRVRLVMPERRSHLSRNVGARLQSLRSFLVIGRRAGRDGALRTRLHSRVRRGDGRAGLPSEGRTVLSARAPPPRRGRFTGDSEVAVMPRRGPKPMEWNGCCPVGNGLVAQRTRRWSNASKVGAAHVQG